MSAPFFVRGEIIADADGVVGKVSMTITPAPAVYVLVRSNGLKHTCRGPVRAASEQERGVYWDAWLAHLREASGRRLPA